MAISDVYTARNLNSGTNAPLATTSTVALLSLFGLATKRLWVVGVRVELGNTSATSGNVVLFQLARPALTTPSGNSLVTGSAHDFSAPNSLGVNCVSWTTTPTLGTVLWEQTLPQTSGSAWEEFPPLGYEWGVPAQASAGGGTAPGVHMFATPTVNTSTPVYVDLVWSE
jgi:hypothetical protein